MLPGQDRSDQMHILQWLEDGGLWGGRRERKTQMVESAEELECDSCACSNALMTSFKVEADTHLDEDFS